MARFGLTAFVLLVVLLAGMTVGAVAAEIAGDRREARQETLDLLLTTRLTSAEIILVTLAARLIAPRLGWPQRRPWWRWWSSWAESIPGWRRLLARVSFRGQSRWQRSSAAVSVIAPTAQRAFGLTVALTAAWFGGPIGTYLLLPRLWPAGFRVVRPALLWLIESSPVIALANLAGLISPMTFPAAMLWMIALQLAGAVVLIVWAIWRLRPATRELSDGEARSRVLRASRPLDASARLRR